MENITEEDYVICVYISIITLILAYAGKHVYPHFSQNGLVSWHRHHPLSSASSAIGDRDALQPLAIAVKIIIDDSGLRFLALGDTRQQSRAAEQVHECRAVRELLEHLDVLLCEHPLLSLKRKRCRQVLFSYCLMFYDVAKVGLFMKTDSYNNPSFVSTNTRKTSGHPQSIS